MICWFNCKEETPIAITGFQMNFCTFSIEWFLLSMPKLSGLI